MKGFVVESDMRFLIKLIPAREAPQSTLVVSENDDFWQ
jgi:hypothetical protein